MTRTKIERKRLQRQENDNLIIDDFDLTQGQQKMN